MDKMVMPHKKDNNIPFRKLCLIQPLSSEIQRQQNAHTSIYKKKNEIEVALMNKPRQKQHFISTFQPATN